MIGENEADPDQHPTAAVKKSTKGSAVGGSLRGMAPFSPLYSRKGTPHAPRPFIICGGVELYRGWTPLPLEPAPMVTGVCGWGVGLRE